MRESRFVVEEEIAGTRQHADRVRRAVISRLPAHGDFEVDLSRVSSMSGAFADELVGRLLSEHRSPPRFVFVTANPRVARKIDVALARRGLTGWLREMPGSRAKAVGAPIAVVG